MGRPRKGDRVSIMAKPERPLAEIVQRNATALGMSYGDYLVAIAAHALDMPELAPKPTHPLDAIEALSFDELDAPLVPATVAPISVLPNAKEHRDKIAS